MERRRTLVAVLCGCAALPDVDAQPKPRAFRIGYLHPTDPQDVAYPAFLRGLKELGYTVGQDLLVEAKFADGKPERLDAMAADMVDQHVDVIVASSPAAIHAARVATRNIPIVMAFSGDDPVKTGIAASLSHPGGNTTGLTAIAADIVAKKLELLLALVPGLKSVAVMRSPRGVDHTAQIDALRVPAQARGIRLQVVEVTEAADYPPAFARIVDADTRSLVVLSGPEFTQQRQQLVSLSARYRLPAVYSFSNFVEIGGLASYGPDIVDLSSRAAGYVDRILHGANPADMPIERPRKLYLAINQTTALSLGLKISQTLLLQADRLIR